MILSLQSDHFELFVQRASASSDEGSTVFRGGYTRFSRLKIAHIAKKYDVPYDVFGSAIEARTERKLNCVPRRIYPLLPAENCTHCEEI